MNQRIGSLNTKIVLRFQFSSISVLHKSTSMKKGGVSMDCCAIIRKIGGGRIFRSVALATAMLAGMTAAGNAQTKFKVQHSDGNFTMLPTYIAYEEGFFKKNGLDVELINLNQSTVAVSAVSGGSIDVMFIAPTFIMVFNTKNPDHPLRMVVNTIEGPIYSLIGKNELIDACPEAKLPYPEPIKCLKGKRIGVTAIGSDNYFTARSLLAEGGLKESDAYVLALGGSVVLANALRAGQADYIVSVEPSRAMLVDNLKIGRDLVDLRKGALMDSWSGHAAFAPKASIEKNPEKYRLFAASISEAINFINDPKNDDKVVKSFKKHSAADEAIIRAMLLQNRAGFSSKTSCKALDNGVKWLIETQQIASSQATNCSDFVWQP
ncbi:ABC transporter substrate-binding protein [Microvirga alba]|uniref:ABC transporter substrate-binding protein n=1 Tax=Microvirga alba TaxID=2791025 RepID=A0A931BVJ8_9HYPH|nr:ABC transporter substrate-binding protein [Microvirga alba]MBF9235503.1 ABC transporter substrate-binding protein [Microvirga alba]